MALKFGTNKSETIIGSPYDDVIFGLDGEDVLIGFKGKDKLVGQDGDDELWGGDGDDLLLGANGDDFLTGGAGADLLDGGADDDRASYFDSPAGVTVNLQTGTGSGGEAEGDTLLSIEALTGSQFNDFLTADNGGSVLFGVAGDDVLKGGGGADHLMGGADDDILIGGNDTFDGGDLLEGGDGIDYLHGGAGNDVLSGGTGRDSLSGGDGEDKFVFVAPYGGTYSPASDPDYILDFGASPRSHDWIDMPTSENYLEPANGYEAIGYDAGYDAARKWVEDLKIGQYNSTNVFVTDGVDGYLFGIYAGKLQTGIVLVGVTSFDYSDII
jgi:Ca2+-binding RTX toxin-like protein